MLLVISLDLNNKRGVNPVCDFDFFKLFVCEFHFCEILVIGFHPRTENGLPTQNEGFFQIELIQAVQCLTPPSFCEPTTSYFALREYSLRVTNYLYLITRLCVQTWFLYYSLALHQGQN